MPPLAERLRLAERTMTALVADARAAAEDRRPSAARRARSPTRCRPTSAARTPDGSGDLLGIKWIAGFPANRARDLAAIHGLVLLTDPATGVPIAILDAGPITAERTAAISGVAIARFAPDVAGAAGARRDARRRRPGPQPPRGPRRTSCRASSSTVFDRHPDRAAALAAEAARDARASARPPRPATRARGDRSRRRRRDRRVVRPGRRSASR